MLRFILLACLTAFVATAPVFAHPEKDAPAMGVEIGTLFGFSRISWATAGGPITLLGVPATPVGNSGFGIGNPSLYVSWFPSERLAIGPEFGFGDFGARSFDGAYLSKSYLYLGGQGAFFLQSNAVSSPYLLGNGALSGVYWESGSSHHDFAAGVGLGYQWRVGPAFVLKAEGRYRQWFRELDEDEFSLLLGLGTRLGGR